MTILTPTAEMYDFVPVVDGVVFEAGARNQSVCLSFSININDDSIVEEKEVFYITIASNASRVFVGDRNSAAIVIADDDCKPQGDMLQS